MMDPTAKLGMKAHEMQELRVHGLLSGTVEPRPIGFSSSIWPSATPSAAPSGFFNGISHRLPMICFSRRPRGPRHAQWQSLCGKMPWFADRPDSFAVRGYVPPNMQVFVRIDQVRALVTWPLASDPYQVVYHSLFPKEYFELPDFAVKAKVDHDYLVGVLA